MDKWITGLFILGLLLGIGFVTLYSETTQISAQDIRLGLVAYYPLDEGLGTKTKDISGYDNVGTLINSPIWQKCFFNNCLNFTSTNSVVNIVNSYQGLFYGLTACAWIKIDNNTLGINQRIFNDFIFNGSFYGFNLDITIGQNLRFEIGDASGSDYSIVWNTVFPIHTSFWICGVWQEHGEIILYGNASILTMTTSVGSIPITINFNEMNIGSTQSNNNVLGIIDEIRLYNYALTQIQIQSQYQYYENILKG